MYADREEEAIVQQRLRRLTNGSSNGTQALRRRMSRSPSRSPPSSTSRGSSRSRSPPRRGRYRSTSRDRSDFEEAKRARGGLDELRGRDSTESRERELQEQLRRRAIMSRGSRLANVAHASPRSSTEVLGESRGSSPGSDRRQRERRERRQGRDVVRETSAGGGEEEDDGDRVERRQRRRRRADSQDVESVEEQQRSGRGHDETEARRTRRSSNYNDEDDRRGSRRGGSLRRGGDSEHDNDYDRYSRQRSYGPIGSEMMDDAYYHRRPGRRTEKYDSPRGYQPHPPRRRYDDRYGPPPPDVYYDRRPHRYGRSPSPPPRRRRGESRPGSPDFDDYEMRSIFCSQLAARLTQRDLGEFFESKLGEGTVMDVKIVMDKITGRSKGVGYVELKNEALVDEALALSGTVLFGIPIVVQKTDAARNKVTSSSEAARPNLTATALAADQAALLPQLDGQPIHIDPANVPSTASRLYVGNLHFSLTEADVKSVFEPFGAILAVDLHREPGTMKSKGFAFVQFVNSDIAEKAIEHMNGFELAGRQIRVGHVNSARASGNGTTAPSSRAAEGPSSAAVAAMDASGASATLTSSFDEGGGGGLTASSRAALMEKLARIDQQSSPTAAVPTEQQRPSSIPQASSRCVLLKNMFNPEEETERGWDKELAEDIKEECENKYGKVDAIKVDVDTLGEVWVRFADFDGAQKAIQGLNGRFFGGRSISASFVNEGIMKSMLG